MWTPSEQREIDRQVRNALERLWRTGETLLEKPTVAAERAALLHYLVNVFPETLRRTDANLRAAWEAAGARPRTPRRSGGLAAFAIRHMGGRRPRRPPPRDPGRHPRDPC